MTDDRTETITDPAAIRATDEPDPFRRNPVRRTGPDDPWRFTRFVADDHECVIVRDEYDEPAPFGSCSTHRRALSSPVALGCTTPAPVGAAVALDLDAVHETICDNFTGMAEVRQAADLLVAEVRRLTAEAETQREWSEAADAAAERRLDQSIAWMERAESAEAEVVTLRAKVGTVEAEKEAILGQVDQAARLLRLNGKQADAQTVIAQVRRWPEFVDRAALATTGEGQ